MNARLEWLRDVELFTESDRAHFAAVHALAAMDAHERCTCASIAREHDGRIDWYDPDTGEITTRIMGAVRVCKHESRALWHRNRAAAQRERFVRVGQCGLDSVAFSCGSCNAAHGANPVRCGNYRVCVSCRGHRAAELRARFAKAHDAAMGITRPSMPQHLTDTQRARRASVLKARRASVNYMRIRGGRERFLTLTFPDTGYPAADVKAIYSAWPKFVRRLRAYLRDEYGLAQDHVRVMPFVRVVEVTPGQTGGHVHLHVWAFCPYLPHVVLRQLWARSLPEDARARLPVHDLEDELGMSALDALKAERAGTLALPARNVLRAARARSDGAKLSHELYWPVLDVRACDGSSAGKELIKYLVKDQATPGDEGTLIDSWDFSRIFVALEGRRTIVTSRYFWLVGDRHACAHCAAVGFTKMRIERAPIFSMRWHPPPRA